MPTFTTIGPRHFVSLVTGPSHVRLGVRFSTSPVASPSVVREAPISGCGHGELDEVVIVNAVLAGIAEVSSSLFAAEVIYVADDSPQYSLYTRCAKLLADRFINGLP
jgi:hypothetical protein